MTSVVDNLGTNTLKNRLLGLGQGAHQWDLATAFLSLEGLRLLDGALESVECVRLLFGEDADRLERVEIMRRMRERSEIALRDARKEDPTLEGLSHFERLLNEGKVQVRVYRKNEANTEARGAFHAKVYIAHHAGHEPYKAIAGSGNLSKNGLTRNIELGLKASDDQAGQLAAWFQARWEEAVEDDVTGLIKTELRRHTDLYPPRAIFLRALWEWGNWIQGHETLDKNDMIERLDPHQEEGYRRALKVLQRENGVLVCDGVGLGKSFIALALMEHFLGEGKNVLLVAPKAILDATWKTYFRLYLFKHGGDFKVLADRYITGFQEFPARAKGSKEEEIAAKFEQKNQTEAREEFLDNLVRLGRSAHVIVIDESHNLRTPAAERYLNMLSVLATESPEPKKVVLLTATPLNTKHTDLTAQFALAKCSTDARIGGKPLAELRPLATRLDNEMA
ncbi:MAG: DEAD/DEAH box helicase family protein, partial [Fimbriimonas sp.]